VTRLTRSVLTLTLIALGAILCRLAVAPSGAYAQSTTQLPGLPNPLPPLPEVLPSWFPAVWSQSLLSPKPSSEPPTPGSTPAVIAQYFENPDPTGTVGTYQPDGATETEGNAYFTSLGTNGRTCFTCHQPQSGWGLNPASAQSIFNATKGTDPLFAPVDGAVCPDAGAAAKTLSEKQSAASQLLTKANIRIFLPVPANAQFKVRILHDPYGCENSAKYGLPTGVISMYRRVMNATNLTRNAQVGPPPAQQGTIMWDGREPSLQSQFQDATLGHAQASKPPTSAEISQGVAFETGLFTMQATDQHAGSLSKLPANGGPVNLSRIGLPNVPVFEIPFSFIAYEGWEMSANSAQASINRGETIFDTNTFTINGVAGFNNVGSTTINFPSGVPTSGPITGTCSTCHNNLNVGADTVGGGRHLGIGDNSSSDKSGFQTTATVLPPTSDQPLFAFDCPVGSIPFFSNPVTVNGKTYDEFQTTDPGMGLISGSCADLGKFKVPRLDGLASRAPYFHNGNAASLSQLVQFYDTRFSIGLSAQDKQDLINFLNSL
jgi:cytochrome c peroxidase